MKKLLFLIMLLPLVSLSQVSSWRTNPPRANYSTPAPRIQSQNDNVSRWRDVPPREFNRPAPNKPGSNVIIHNPYSFYNSWGWGNWGLWGAPMFGYSYYSPYWYHGAYGYRQPARVYVYEDGRKDTIFGKKPIINFGISKTNNEQLGGFFAIGNKGYFIFCFNRYNRPPKGKIRQGIVNSRHREPLYSLSQKKL